MAKRLIQIITSVAILAMASVVVVSTANAATITSGNDFPTTLQTSTAADHELIFTTPSGVSEGDTITVTFSSEFDTSSLTEDDVDISDDTVQLTTAANCSGSEEASITIAGDVITITICTGDGGAIAATSVVNVRIGTNAINSGTGANQVTNPSTAKTYFMTIGGTFGDSGAIALPVGSDDSIDITVSYPEPSSGGGGDGSSSETPAETDTTAPTISDILVSGITADEATLTFTTSEAATHSVVYGTTTDMTDGTLTSSSYRTSHSNTFSGLSEGITYYFQITATDIDGNASTSSVQSFRTLDETAPVITDIEVTSITTTSAVVTWTTDEDADSTVSYGLDSSYGSTAEDETLTTSHSVTLTGLTEGTTYHFQVLSSDASLNQSFSSDNTLETDADEPPANVSGLSASAFTGTHDLSWVNPTDEDFAGVYLLVCLDDYPDSESDSDCTISDLGDVESYTNSGTTDGTTYYYGVFAYDDSGQFASGALVSATSSASEEEEPSDEDDGGEESDSPVTEEEEPSDDGDTTEEDSSDEDTSTGSADSCGDSVCSTTESDVSCPVDCASDEAEEEDDEEPTSLGAEVSDFSDTDLVYTVAQGEIELTARSGVVDVLPTSTLSISINSAELADNVSSVQLTIGSESYLMRLDDALALYEAVVTVPNVLTILELTILVEYEDGSTETVSSYLNVLSQGQVYQVIDGEETAVSTATVTLFSVSGSEQIAWDGSPYDQFNPTSVGSAGTFAWYVPNGTYIVRGEATGFEGSQTSELSITNFIINPRLALEAALPEEEEDQEEEIEEEEPVPPVETETPQEPQVEEQDEPTLVTAVLESAPVVVVQETLEIIREVPGVEEAAEISTPTLAVTAGASVVVLSVAFDFLPFLQYLFTAPVLFFWRKRRKGYGVVYNAISKTPVDLAVVRVYEFTAEDEAAGRHGRLVKSRVTDKGGRYFFLVPPGRYMMTVTKTAFEFPSEYLQGETTDGQFVDVYHGEAIEVSEKEAVITANIPMDPSQADKFQEPTSVAKHARLRALQHGVASIGMIAAIIFAIIRPTLFSIAMIGVQIGVYVLARRLARPRKPVSWGIVYDKETGRPLSKVVARIFEPKYNKLLETQVTDSKGRYAFMLGPNQYYAVFAKDGFKQKEITPIDFTDAPEPKDFSEEVHLESEE